MERFLFQGLERKRLEIISMQKRRESQKYRMDLVLGELRAMADRVDEAQKESQISNYMEQGMGKVNLEDFPSHGIKTSFFVEKANYPMPFQMY